MRVLVIKLSSLGDLFHALPAVHALKAGLAADVDWVVNDAYTGLVGCFTDVSRVIPFPRGRTLRHFPAFLKDLRRERYDLVVDLQGLLKSAIIGRLARGGRRIGPSFQREGARMFYDEVAGVLDKNRHAIEENLEIARSLGGAVGPPAFPVRYEVPDLKEPRPRVGMVVLSRWATKNWPADCFAEVGRRLQQTIGASIYLFGGPENVAVHQQILDGLTAPAVELAGRCSLADMPGMLKAMDLLIANDTGPVHIAAAVGTPVLVIFGPTDPVRTGPYGPNHRIVRASVACQPCLSRTCHRGTVECLHGVTPERVAEVALEMLGRAGKGNRT